MNTNFGICKMDIKKGEVIAQINIYTGEVYSNNIRFLPWGKTKVRNWIFNKFQIFRKGGHP